MYYQLIHISILIWIWRRKVAMCYHSCEMRLTKFIIEAYVMTRVWKIRSTNMWLLSSKISNCNWFILNSRIPLCCSLTVYSASNFIIFTEGTCYMLRTDGSDFHFISTVCPKMAQSYVFVYRYSRYVIFQRPEILRPLWYLRESQSTFPYEYIPENVCVIFLLYIISAMTCKWKSESTDLHVEVLCTIPEIICSKRSK
jgi:hypothetical protein